MKIIAFYLPQFHNIPENDKWWGDGFTEWTNVRAAKPIFEGHQQPRTPLNNNYYDLLNDDVKIWQAKIAKQYGIYGFCYYHYWFNGKMLLEKPMEQMLRNKSIDIPFCICWANAAWSKSWLGNEKQILISQTYGDADEWKEHFEYFYQFFLDSRYMRIDDKPIIIIYRPEAVACLTEMIACWRQLAKTRGLRGLSVMGITSTPYMENIDVGNCLDRIIEWQPTIVKMKKSANRVVENIKKLRRGVYNYCDQALGIDLYRYSPIKAMKVQKNKFMKYDDVWEKINRLEPLCQKSIPGAFVRWDNTPRFRENATVIVDDSPEKFRYYLSKQINHTKNDYKSDMIFMFAWNEWAEGGYLEPDETDKYAYLEAVRSALIENGEFPNWDE